MIPRVIQPPILALLAAVLTVTGCSGGSEIQADGAAFKNAEAVLAQGQSKWLASIKGERATQKEPRCYYLVADSLPKAVLEQVFCGPIRRFAVESDQVWDVYDLMKTKDANGDTTGRLQNDSDADKSEPLPAGFSLIRPDGEEPPSDATKLAAPPPPPLPPGEVKITTETLNEPALKDLAAATVRTPLELITVRKVGTADSVGEGADAKGPGDGEELLVLEITSARAPAFEGEIEPSGSDPDPTANAKPESKFALDIDGRQMPVFLQPVEAQSSTDEAEQGQQLLLVASVPAGATKKSLIATTAGKSQSLDLTTGSRSSEVSTAYYRNSPEVDVVGEFDTEGQEKVGDFSLDYGGAVQTVYLTSWDVEAGWAPAGKAWLEVPVFGYRNDWFRPAWEYTEDPKSYQLSTGNQRYTAEKSAGGPNTIAFLVPENFNAGTFTWRPAGTFKRDRDYTNLDPASGRFVAKGILRVNMRFPAS